jgi:hypothetical protein
MDSSYQGRIGNNDERAFSLSEGKSKGEDEELSSVNTESRNEGDNLSVDNKEEAKVEENRELPTKLPEREDGGSNMSEEVGEIGNSVPILGENEMSQKFGDELPRDNLAPDIPPTSKEPVPEMRRRGRHELSFDNAMSNPNARGECAPSMREDDSSFCSALLRKKGKESKIGEHESSNNEEVATAQSKSFKVDSGSSENQGNAPAEIMPQNTAGVCSLRQYISIFYDGVCWILHAVYGYSSEKASYLKDAFVNKMGLSAYGNYVETLDDDDSLPSEENSQKTSVKKKL